MGTFFLAMALDPEVQKRAQKELDAVVGTERLPEPSDRPSLPYVNALVKELFRWHLATPIRAPHRVVADDEYNGYLIPGGATVFVNMWSVYRSCLLAWQYLKVVSRAILHDPEVYPQPNDFMPERFLDSEELGRSGARPYACHVRLRTPVRLAGPRIQRQHAHSYILQIVPREVFRRVDAVHPLRLCPLGVRHRGARR